MNPEDFKTIAADFGTPAYIYCVESVRDAWRRLTSAFSYRPIDFHYAIVCNKNPYLVREIVGLGAGIHANTPGDAYAALQAGVSPDRIVYSGTNLDAQDMEFLVSRHIKMNVDSLDQLRDAVARGDVRSLGLRLLIDPEEKPNRIGIAPGELNEALKIARAGGIRLIGLHMYAGTNTRKVERFLECFDRLLVASEKLPDLEYLDLGGGFGVAYRTGEAPLDIAELGEQISRRLTGFNRPIRLIIEPGRTLVAEAGTLLVRVTSVKSRGGRRYVGVDATVGNIVVESVYSPWHRLEALVPRGACLDIATDVCGNTTHSRDFLAKDRRLPELLRGDLLLLRDVGAYGYAMSSHFLNRPRPPEIVFDKGELIRATRRETFEDLLG
jgi:diaminopimelate decarboxylase